MGRWVGGPDSMAERDRRVPSPVSDSPQEAPATGEEQVANLESGQSPSQTQPIAGSQKSPKNSASQTDAEATDLESFDFRLTLEFAEGGQLEMHKGENQQPLSGTWQVLSRTGNRAQLEIAASRGGEVSKESKLEQRRFELVLEPGANGFTLREEGADPKFGWLYFERQE